MGDLFKVELYKLKRSKIFYVVFIYLLVISVAMPFLYDDLETGFTIQSGDEALQFFSNLGSVMALYISFILSIGLTNEFTSGFITDAIAFGYRRKHIYQAKLFTLSLSSVICGLPFIVIPVSYYTIANGSGWESQTEFFFYVLRFLILYLFNIVAIASFICLLAFLFKKLSRQLITFVLTNGIAMLPMMLELSNSNPIKKLYDYSIFQMAVKSSEKELGFTSIALLVLSCLIVSVGCYVIGAKFFEKDEIK